MNLEATPPWIIVPGWGGSGPDHWQSHWAEAADATRVELDDWHDPRRATWITAIDRAFARQARLDARPPIVIAHSLGCIAVAEWARTTRRAVRAALLVAPADVDRASCADRFHDFQPLPRDPLPFRSLVVSSDDDPYITLARAREVALTWGSSLHVFAAGGHLNAASGLGRWSDGQALLVALMRETSIARECRSSALT
jgi:uncharacterized protein